MNIAKMIDHSLLRPELTTNDVVRGCEIAARRSTAAVCVRPSDVPIAVTALAGTGVLVGSVAGFPHGDTMTATKVAEVRALVEAGATRSTWCCTSAGSATATAATSTTTSPRSSPPRRAVS